MPVITARAEKKNVTVVEKTIGTVVSPATVQVTAQVQGRLLKAYFQEGQLVHKGDPLFLIDPEPFENALAQAKAQLAKDMANAESARNDQKRYTALFAQNAISEQARDQAVATAKADDATVEADKAAVNIAQENLGYTRILSPIDGKTGPILIQPGNLITVAGIDAPGHHHPDPADQGFLLPAAEPARPRSRTRWRRASSMATVPMPGAAGGAGEGQGGFHLQCRSAPTPAPSNCAPPSPMTISGWCPARAVNVGVTLNQIPGATVVPRDAVNVGPDSSLCLCGGQRTTWSSSKTGHGAE